MSKIAMARLVQQRIVGASVLVLLGVILIPLVLDGDGVYRDPYRKIPGQPEPARAFTFSEIPLPPERPETEKIIALPVDASLDSANIPLQQADKSMDAKIVEGWVIQLGSFKHKENALRLQVSLRKEGYTAFIEENMINLQRLYQVKVGPALEKEKLERIAKIIRQKFAIEVILIKAY